MFSLVYELVRKTLPSPSAHLTSELINSFIFIHAAMQFDDGPTPGTDKAGK